MQIDCNDIGNNRRYRLRSVHTILGDITIQRAPDKYADYQGLFDRLAIEILTREALKEELIDPVTEICHSIPVFKLECNKEKETNNV